jgi:hypothetical protein
MLHHFDNTRSFSAKETLYGVEAYEVNWESYASPTLFPDTAPLITSCSEPERF